MATYPTGVAAFTTKNNGDTIQPSHINGLQDEITAIEDGILNGTAPLNSSRVTAPSLQISGNSTFVGTVTFSSNAVSSGQFTAANQPAWHCFSSVVQTGTASSTLSVAFESELFDQGNFHSTAASTNGAMVVPTGSSGLYHLGASAYLLTAASNFFLSLTKNSSREISNQYTTPASGNVSGVVTGLLRLDAGDIVRFEIQGPASTWSVGFTAANYGMRCWGAKLS